MSTNNSSNHSSSIQTGEWIKDSALQNIPEIKLQFLHLVAFESQNLKPNEMVPFFMTAMKKSKEKNISFSEEEMNLILAVCQKYASAEELTRINQILQLRKHI